MGGYGSGQHWARRARHTVEDCHVLDLNALIRDGGLDHPQFSGIIHWSHRWSSTPFASIRFTVDTDARQFGVSYRLTDQNDEVEYTIPLTTAPLPWGGERWWFTCPLVCDGKTCGRRVGKLYLPPNSRYFGCRHCHDLTYTSSQESRKYDSLFRRVAINGQLDERDLLNLDDAEYEARMMRRIERNAQRRRRRKAMGWK